MADEVEFSQQRRTLKRSRKGNPRFRKTRMRNKNGKMQTVYRKKRGSPAASNERKRRSRK